MDSRAQFTFHVLDGLNERARALGVEILTRPVAGAAEEIGPVLRGGGRQYSRRLPFPDARDEDMLPLTQGFAKPIVLMNGDDPAMRHSSVTPCNRAAAQYGDRPI